MYGDVLRRLFVGTPVSERPGSVLRVRQACRRFWRLSRLSYVYEVLVPRNRAMITRGLCTGKRQLWRSYGTSSMSNSGTGLEWQPISDAAPVILRQHHLALACPVTSRAAGPRDITLLCAIASNYLERTHLRWDPEAMEYACIVQRQTLLEEDETGPSRRFRILQSMFGGTVILTSRTTDRFLGLWDVQDDQPLCQRGRIHLLESPVFADTVTVSEQEAWVTCSDASDGLSVYRVPRDSTRSPELLWHNPAPFTEPARFDVACVAVSAQHAACGSVGRGRYAPVYRVFHLETGELRHTLREFLSEKTAQWFTHHLSTDFTALVRLTATHAFTTHASDIGIAVWDLATGRELHRVVRPVPRVRDHLLTDVRVLDAHGALLRLPGEDDDMVACKIVGCTRDGRAVEVVDVLGATVRPPTSLRLRRHDALLAATTATSTGRQLPPDATRARFDGLPPGVPGIAARPLWVVGRGCADGRESLHLHHL